MSIPKYTAVNSTTFTDKDIERWAAEAESDQGYTGDHIDPSVSGWPVSVGAETQPFTLR